MRTLFSLFIYNISNYLISNFRDSHKEIQTEKNTKFSRNSSKRYKQESIEMDDYEEYATSKFF